MDTIRQMNPTIWFFAGLLILWVIAQALIYLKFTLSFNKKNSLMNTTELKDCFKVGAVAAVGPAINSAAIILTLIASIGSATAFMRCGVIGAPLQEMYVAQIGATTAGVEFGTEAFTPAVFTFVIFCMGFAAVPYFLNCVLALKPLDLAVEKAKEEKSEVTFIPYLADSAVIAILVFILVDYFFVLDKAIAVVATLVVGAILYTVAEKTNNKFLNTFNLVICMVVGMGVGEIVNQIIK